MNKKQACVSFIVTCYNLETYIEECMDSIIGQDYPQDHYEVVCIDDGSTDGSNEILNGYRKRFKNVKIQRIENSGLEKACNLGIRRAAFPWICRVDGDDFLGAGFLPKMDQALTIHPGFDFYYCKEYYEYYSKDDKHFKTLPSFDQKEIFERGDFFATGTLYRRLDLEAAGLYPEETKNCGLENYSLILDLLSKGKAGFAVEGAQFYYRRHHSNMSVLKRDEILSFGKNLLDKYGRKYRTNQYHPYGLTLRS